MSHQWFTRAALLAVAAALLALGLLPLTPSLAAPPLALTASAEPPTRMPTSIPTFRPQVTSTPAPGPHATSTPAPDVTSPPAPSSTVVDVPAEGGGASIDLLISKEVSPGSAAPAERVTFVLTVICAGSGQAKNVVISDDLPAGLALIDATTSWGDLTTSGRTVRVTIPVLYPGDRVTVRIVAQLEPGAPAALVNQAAMTTDSEERDLTNNTASATVNVGQPTVTPTPIADPTTTVLPVVLPPTGGPRSDPPAWPTLALIAAALVAAGLAVRRRA